MQQTYNDIPWRVGTYEVFTSVNNLNDNQYGRFYFFNNIGMSKDNIRAVLSGLNYNFLSVTSGYKYNLLKISNASSGLNAEYIEVTAKYEDNPDDESDDKFMHVQVKHKPFGGDPSEDFTTWDFWADTTGPEAIGLTVDMDATGGNTANTEITVKIGTAASQSATLSFQIYAGGGLRTVMCDIYQYEEYTFSSQNMRLTVTGKAGYMEEPPVTVYDLWFAKTYTGFDPLMQAPIATWGILQHDYTNAGQYTGTLKFNAAGNWLMSVAGSTRYLCGPEWIYFNPLSSI